MSRPRGAAAALAWGVGLQVGWLVLVGTDHDATLATSDALEGLGLSGRGNALALAAGVVLPLVALAAVFGRVARGRGRRAGRDPGLRPAALLLGSAALLGGGFLANGDYLLYRFAPVEPGVLYRSGQTSRAVLSQLIDDHGIRTLVVLRDEPGFVERERALAADRGLRFEHIPMGDPAAGVERFLSVMEDPESLPVLVHCHYGVARSGVVSAIYRIEYQGWENDRALDEARRFAGFDTLGDGSRKRIYLLSYVPEHERRPR